ncbi:MAG: transglutaminase domain-containing protein [Faecousia sp.]
MKFKFTALLLLAAALLLTGCGWMDGEYVSVVPHQEPAASGPTGSVSAASYQELIDVLEKLVLAGSESCVIDVGEFPQKNLDSSMQSASRYIREVFPMGAYAVEDIDYELGANSGRPAVAVAISYRRSRTEIQRIRKKADMDGLAATVRTALDDHASRVAVLVSQYAEADFDQLIQDYARENPQKVMEVPQVSEGIYGSGGARVVELSFTYQNSREALRQMQSQVKPVFEAAALYVSGEGSQRQKLSQLYGFLMERFDYKQETSITPAYSLLCHGVGDSRAFAEVYAAMCRRAGLESMVVTGTKAGEPWTWNIVLDGEGYYHVDLLRSSAEGGFREYTDAEMTGYVWDYSTYPACGGVPQPPEPAQTDPTESTAEP